MAAREKLRLCGRRSRPHCGLLASQTQRPLFLSLQNTPRRFLFGSGKIKFPSKSTRLPYDMWIGAVGNFSYLFGELLN